MFAHLDTVDAIYVSMESGLEDRNNPVVQDADSWVEQVSMESGLEDRNNGTWEAVEAYQIAVSMESGLEDRNNAIDRAT